MFVCEGKEKTSQYRGVYLHKNKRKWCAFVYLKGQNQKYCGGFDNELDAAKKVNELCQDFGIPLHNPGVVEMLTQVSQITKTTLTLIWLGGIFFERFHPKTFLGVF